MSKQIKPASSIGQDLVLWLPACLALFGVKMLKKICFEGF